MQSPPLSGGWCDALMRLVPRNDGLIGVGMGYGWMGWGMGGWDGVWVDGMGYGMRYEWMRWGMSG